MVKSMQFLPIAISTSPFFKEYAPIVLARWPQLLWLEDRHGSLSLMPLWPGIHANDMLFFIATLLSILMHFSTIADLISTDEFT